MRVAGIDLAGKFENPTGFCSISDGTAEIKLLYKDDEILGEVERVKPDCIAIDAPFWLPQTGLWRPSEIKLISKGFTPLSPMLPNVRMLSLRASLLVKALRSRGFRVIEVFSRASEEVLGLSKEPRKNKDEYDALVCAMTAKCYMEGNYEDIDGIILPK